MHKDKVIGKAGKSNLCFRQEKLSDHAGAVRLQEFLTRHELPALLDQQNQVKSRAAGYGDAQQILALCWNLLLGGSCLSDREALRGDPAA